MELTREQESAFAALDDCEQRFALAILAGKSGEQAVKAGWPKDESIKHGTVRNRPAVRYFLTKMQSAYISDAIMTRNEAMERLSSIARATIDDVVQVKKVNWGSDEDPDYQVTWTVRDDAPGMAAVKSIGSSPQGPKVELHSPLIALKQLAELAGWVQDPNAPQGDLIEGQVVDVSKLSNETLHELVLTYYKTEQEA
jgi:phage terminase small subunit